jgi:RNA polymerase sigma-54 factor
MKECNMRQYQKLATVQKLAMTQVMRNSLDLLNMGPEEVIDEAEKEKKRNPFLKIIPNILRGGSEAGFDPSKVKEEETNNEILLKQVSLIRLSPDQSRIAAELVYCLDERGYICDPASEVCIYLGVPNRVLMEIVSILQRSVEPAGVFAWSLKDSFRIQLEAKNRYDPVIAKLLDRLDLVANKKINDICTLCEVDEEDAVEMLDDIRLLSPAPLQPISVGSEKLRSAELVFSLDDDGKVSVRLNEAALPQMLKDDALFSVIKTAETDKNAITYYRDCYRSAAGFVIAMQKRANTLLKIGQTIARRQSKFIITGRDLDRKPLTMGWLATEIGLNKSTISRALNNSVFDSDRGIVKPSDCFVRPLNAEGIDRTREQVLQRLSLLIRTESKIKPLSDYLLAQQLETAGFKISRRTVAKYRGLLGLQGVYERKRNS